MIFQSISGSEKGMAEFGIDVALLDEALDLTIAALWAITSWHFETGQGSALSAEANYGCDQVTMEARYGLAPPLRAFLVNTVVGFINWNISIITS